MYNNTREFTRRTQQVQPERKYINIPIFATEVVYVGTSSAEQAHPYYKNSQYFIIETEDNDRQILEFKAEVKQMRMNREKGYLEWNVAADKKISVGITMFQNPREYVTITFQDLYDVIAGTKKCRDFFPGRNW